jgi:hypothetical protein
LDRAKFAALGLFQRAPLFFWAQFAAIWRKFRHPSDDGGSPFQPSAFSLVPLQNFKEQGAGAPYNSTLTRLDGNTITIIRFSFWRPRISVASLENRRIIQRLKYE